MASKIDEVSRMLGSMEATQKAINDKITIIAEDTKENKVKIECIEKVVIKDKVRTAYLAGGVSVFSTAGLFIFKARIGEWMHKIGF